MPGPVTTDCITHSCRNAGEVYLLMTDTVQYCLGRESSGDPFFFLVSAGPACPRIMKGHCGCRGAGSALANSWQSWYGLRRASASGLPVKAKCWRRLDHHPVIPAPAAFGFQGVRGRQADRYRLSRAHRICGRPLRWPEVAGAGAVEARHARPGSSGPPSRTILPPESRGDAVIKRIGLRLPLQRFNAGEAPLARHPGRGFTRRLMVLTGARCSTCMHPHIRAL